jgi:hypothetical protein
MKLRFLVVPIPEETEAKQNDQKIISVKWRSARDSVGIVAIHAGRNMDQWEAYIGVSQNTDEHSDAIYIAHHGAKLDKTEACAFFPELDPDLFIH